MIKKSDLKFAIVATDIVIFTVKEAKLLVRLIKVHRPPHFPGTPGIPGGLIFPTETAEQAVNRLIKEKAGIDGRKVYCEQFHTFSEVNRDPRGRVVSVAHIVLVPWEKLSVNEQTSTKELWWEIVSAIPPLAYDHDAILAAALKHLRFQIVHTTASSKLVPREFTLTHLERICEVVLGKKVDKRNFRKKLLKLKVVKKSNRQLRGLQYRPASLYRFTVPHVRDIVVL